MTSPTDSSFQSPVSPGRGVRRVVVLGGGSAGLLAAIALKVRMPQLTVSVLRSREIPIIGVGEGTTFTVPLFLHGYLGIDPGRFHRWVKPTYKLGIRFLWGPRERFHYSFTNQLDSRLPGFSKPNGFHAFDEFEFGDLTGALMAEDRGFARQADGGPLVGTNVAYHLENREFVSFLEACAGEAGVEMRNGEVEQVEVGEMGVRLLHLKEGAAPLSADLFVDCSGFRSELLGKALGEPFESFRSSLFCDRAILGGWERSDEPIKPYTTAETMEGGWSWQIEHDRRINRGYVYSSGFLSDDQAEEEFRRRNPGVTDCGRIHFDSGAYRRSWVKNVVAIGNASGFVEPLEATSLASICDHSARLIQALEDADLDPDDLSRRFFNRYTTRTWNSVRRFLSLHYRFNTRLDTEFWKACRNGVDLAGAEEILDYYEAHGPSLGWANEAMGSGDPFGWEGYLVMLVGQKVPHRNPWRPSIEERSRWSRHQAGLARTARGGFTVSEATALIRSDRWSWKPDFYSGACRW